MTSPSVSVLMPCLDAADTVGDAIEDVLGQSCGDIELLCIHQGPDDATLEALSSVRDPRVQVLRVKAPGLPGALEAGRSVARGEWLLRMDADDRCSPARLERQLAAADPSVDVVACCVESFPRGRERFLRWQNGLLSHEQMYAERFVEVPYFNATALFRARALRAVGGWRSGPFAEDYDLILRLFAAGHRVVKLPERLYRWRIHPGQMTNFWQTGHMRPLKAIHLDPPPEAFLAGTGASLLDWSGLTGLPTVELDPARPELPPGFPVLVFGSARVRARLRAWLGERPHVFVA